MTKGWSQICRGQSIYAVVGLILIALYTALSSIYLMKFAEIHVRLPFLDFPIFIGEILMFMCMVLFVLHIRKVGIRWEKWHWIVVVYGFWVIVKALKGYADYGPLSFRNAALFYYPVFCLFAYYFSRDFSLGDYGNKILLLLFAYVMWFLYVQRYFVFFYIIIVIVLALREKNLWIRIAPVLSLTILIPPDGLLGGPRSHMLGLFCAVLLLIGLYFFFLSRLTLKKKVIWMMLTVIVFLIVLVKFANESKIRSFTSIGPWIALYEKNMGQIAERKEAFEFKRIKTEVFSDERDIGIDAFNSYNATEAKRKLMTKIDEESAIVLEGNEFDRFFLNKEKVIRADIERRIQDYKSKILRGKMSSSEAIKLLNQDARLRISEELERDGLQYLIKEMNVLENKDNTEIFKEQLSFYMFSGLNLYIHKRIGEEREVDVEVGNIFFRFFIWRDMIRDMVKDRAFLWGINFGKPQRSETIEMLEWAKEEYLRVGWITPHNSYLHMFYRGGIVGLAYLYFIFYLFWHLMIQVIRKQSLSGLLFLSLLLYWGVLAMFLVILEMPYYAIPIWATLGIMLRQFSVSREDNALCAA